MGCGGWYNQIPETECPNCGRKMRGGMSSTTWNHGASVCSEACGNRLHQRIENGMLSADDYPGWGSFGFGLRPAYGYTARIQDMRIRIKQLEHRAKAASR